MDSIQQSFSVSFNYKVHFTEHLFNTSNPVLANFLKEESLPAVKQKILFIIDDEVPANHAELLKQIDEYFANISNTQLIPEKLIVKGGEISKNDTICFDKVVDAINRHAIDRHSYIAAIGGGSILDVVGYAAAVSHRGIRHIRIPTTVLAQNDSGVGVKNGINYKGKKNFLGTFAPPSVVFNDQHFLTTLSKRQRISGISEAIKVALIKDSSFFEWLEKNADALASGDKEASRYMVRHCAMLHLHHISGGDPFEKGSSRPLDFGHWSAHKLEQLSNFEILHGEAVAIGIALDTMYSHLSGRLSKESSDRVIQLLLKIGLPITHPLVDLSKNQGVLDGLQEFREHLGGELTIMLLNEIGKGEEVHEMNVSTITEATLRLKNYASQ